MNHKLLALVGVGIASVVAASGGAFLALREPTPAGPRVSTQDTLSDRLLAPGSGGDGIAVNGSASKVVTETEGIISPSPAPTSAPAGSQAEEERSSARKSRTTSSIKPAPAAPAPPPATNRAAGTAGGATVSPAQVPADHQASRWPRSQEPDQRPTSPAPAERDRSATAVVTHDPAPTPPALPAEQAQVQVQAPPAEQAHARPRQPELTEITVPAESVIGLQIDGTISSEQARVEDGVEARVTRDVRAGGRVAFPAGSRMLGSVVMVEKGGKVRERARLGIRFHTLVLADGTRVPVETDTIYREGSSPAGESAAKMGGGAVGGAILGAILGGGRGAAIGGSIGAAAGTAAVLASDRNPATLPAGSTVTVRLQSPATVTVER